MKIQGRRINNLRFADDKEENREATGNLIRLTQLTEAGDKAGLEINISKKTNGEWEEGHGGRTAGGKG